MFDAPIVVGGEALIDVVRRPGAEPESHPGGGPYNTARTLGRLGRGVAFLGPLSLDEDGRRLHDGLEDDDVETAAALDVDLPCTRSEATLDAGGSASYAFRAEGTSAAALTVEHALAAVASEDVRMLHVGSLGLVLEPTATALRAAAEEVAGRALVMVDLNCRPSAIDDRDGYRERVHALLAHTDALKASVEDLAWLEPGTAPLESARALVAELGPRVALVTDGARGATVLGRDGGERHVDSPPVDRVADTLGAGDAFGGGFLAWWDSRDLGAADLGDGDRVEEATAFACLVASRTCLRPGAWPPTLAELGSAAL